MYELILWSGDYYDDHIYVVFESMETVYLQGHLMYIFRYLKH